MYKLLPSDKIESADSPLPERQTETKEVSTDTETVPEDVQLPPELTDIPELNVKEGVRNGGTPEGYLSILSVFYRTAAAKAEELDTLYQNDDIPHLTAIFDAVDNHIFCVELCARLLKKGFKLKCTYLKDLKMYEVRY